MSTRKKWISLIVAGTLAAILLGANGPLGGFWGEGGGDDGVDPTGGPLAALIGATIIEAIAFGVGVAWIAFGWSIVKRFDRPLGVSTYLAISWALVSWAPHTSFHQSLGDDNYAGLAAIEWGFHVTLVIGAFIVAAFVWQVFRGSEPSVPTPAATAA